MNRSFSYSIITPAFNEELFLEQTIKSVLGQTILPQKWIIVDDGSTDRTAELVQKYACNHKCILYHYRIKPDGQAYYASNVLAIMEGWQLLQGDSFDYLAILDADITLPNDYYEKIIGQFHNDDTLGVASGIYENLINGQLCKVLSDRRSTPKAIQVFRRQVFEEIGGFLPLQYGGEDTIACVMTRMAGWKAWSFPDIKVIHNRPTGTGKNGNIFRIRFNQGICEYNIGAYFPFFFLKMMKRAVLEKPYFWGSVCRMGGYLWALIRGDRTILPDTVATFIKNEHINRILKLNKLPR